MKKSQRKARKQEQRLVMEGHEEQTDKQERAWRANRAYLDKSLDEGAEDKRAYEAYDARMDRYQDQAALDRAEEEERRLRRTSAQWRRNKQLLDREIERGSGKALDPFKLADELFQRAESRKEDAEYREDQKALWRASQQRRRRSEARRKVVGEALQEEEREREANLTASKEEGMRDVEAYRQECLRRDRESLDWHRQKFFDDRAVEEWTKGIAKAAEAEDRELSELARLDCEAYKRRVEEAQKLEEEYRRQQQIEDRFYKEDEELRMREQEAEERRVMLEDRESVSASKRREEQAELDRLEGLRDTPSDKTKLEILEAMWARQTHPAAAAAARGRRRQSSRRLDLRTVIEAGSSAELGTSGGSGSTSSGMGIKGRDSGGGFCSDEDSLLAGWPGSEPEDTGGGGDGGGLRVRAGSGCSAASSSALSMPSLLDQSAMGLVGNVRLAEEEEDEVAVSASWDGSLQQVDDAAAGGKPVVELPLEDEGGGQRSGETHYPPSPANAPAWEGLSHLEDQQAAAAEAAASTMMTAEAAAVLAAAARSFDTPSSSIEGRSVEEAAATAGGGGEPEFPARMLVFSEKETAEQGQGHQSGGSGADDGTAAAAAAAAAASGSATATVGDGGGGDESGVLMMSRTEEAEALVLQPTAAESAAAAASSDGGSPGMVSFDGDDAAGDACRESFVLGLVREVRAEESAAATAADVRAGSPPEDGALASLDGNEGSLAVKDEEATAAAATAAGKEKEEGNRGKEGVVRTTLPAKKTGGPAGDALVATGAAAVPATPITPDGCL
ncbi:unnamed protein product [Ectocarpus sp. CCAP 1310/34]|nr:unnamed protein product [Ectocarpus sp. CCAP 1310/34]